MSNYKIFKINGQGKGTLTDVPPEDIVEIGSNLSGGGSEQNNFNRIPSATYSELGITPESTIEEKQTAITTFLEGYDNAETDNLFFEIKKDLPNFIFDVTADWANPTGIPVTDQASFEFFLQNYSYYSLTNDLTDIVITDFSLVSNRLTCNLQANGTTLTLAGSYFVSEFNSVGNIKGLVNIDLYAAALNTFNPTKALPDTLTYLSLNSADLVEFNPIITLPTTLTMLDLNNNFFTPSGYTASEQWATLQPSFNSLCTISTEFNENSISGTNLETILISKNCIVIP